MLKHEMRTIFFGLNAVTHTDLLTDMMTLVFHTYLSFRPGAKGTASASATKGPGSNPARL
jgi:hypothetical protein